MPTYSTLQFLSPQVVVLRKSVVNCSRHEIRLVLTLFVCFLALVTAMSEMTGDEISKASKPFDFLG